MRRNDSEGESGKGEEEKKILRKNVEKDMIKIKEILGKRYFHLVSSEEPLAGTLGTKEKKAL